MRALGSAEMVAAQSLAGHAPRGGLTAGYWRWKRLLQLAAVVFALAATAVVLFLPGPAEVSTDQNGQLVQLASPSLLESYGPGLLAIAAIPLALTVAPFVARGRGWQPVSIITSVLLVMFAFIASASIGYLYAPAVICAIVALFLHPRTTRL